MCKAAVVANLKLLPIIFLREHTKMKKNFQFTNTRNKFSLVTTDCTTGVRSPAEAKNSSSSLCPDRL
jgi:hypothetical protein